MPSIRKKITKAVVDAARPDDARFIVWDTELKGFGLRVEPSGTKSYFLRYRPRGWGANAPKRFVLIGRHGVLTPEKAREKARSLLGQVADGKDPARDGSARANEPTVADLIDRYLELHVDARLKPRTAEGYRHLLQSYVRPAIGRRRATDVAPGDIDAIHRGLRSKRSTANRVVSITQAMYGWAGKARLAPKGFNPAADVPRFAESPRRRYLKADELQRLGEALRTAETIGLPWQADESKPKAKHLAKVENRVVKVSPYATAAIRLLLFTGARLREILNLRWDWIDIERGLMLLPDSKTGQKTIVLNAPALAVLAGLDRIGPHVIAGEKPDRPRSDIKRPWAQIKRASKIDDLRLHDLRHSFASVGAGEGLGLPIIGNLLGHKRPETTARYAHLAIDPARRASERIAGSIAAAMGEAPEREAEIVAIGRGRG